MGVWQWFMKCLPSVTLEQIGSVISRMPITGGDSAPPLSAILNYGYADQIMHGLIETPQPCHWKIAVANWLLLHSCWWHFGYFSVFVLQSGASTVIATVSIFCFLSQSYFISTYLSRFPKLPLTEVIFESRKLFSCFTLTYAFASV